APAPAPKVGMTKEPHPDDAVTVETPVVKRVVQPDDVTQTVPVPKADPASAAETAVLPPVRPADETAVLPPVRPAAAPQGSGSGSGTGGGTGRARSASRPTAQRPQENPADRVPSGIFRDPANDRTRELPVLGEDGRPQRPRPDWAEETPLDDLPTLADELLGHRDDEDGDEGERRPRRRR
ncbi:dTMP kinase, partial [Streptomyces sp. MB09-01]|nr:dTMP kinase [Streptomyces sp. MB09-01]